MLDWMAAMLSSPDRADYVALRLTREQAQFVLNFYAVDPLTGERRYRRGVLSRPKGWGKSPILAAICAAEGMGPVVPDGWDAAGQPVGRPWSQSRRALVQVAATSEAQTANAWVPLLDMMRNGPVGDELGVEVMETFINLPFGRIEPVTAAPTSREGNVPVFALMDQTESWVSSNGGRLLARVLRRNLGKTGGSSIEAPNAYVPGAGSVAEASALYAEQIVKGQARDEGLLHDHREAPSDVDWEDDAAALNALSVAYGDSAAGPACVIHEPPCTPRAWVSGWVGLPRVLAEFRDPDTGRSEAIRYYANRSVADDDRWMDGNVWRAANVDERPVLGDRITLGFDGSIGTDRPDYIADGTVLRACRLSDGLRWTVGKWEGQRGPWRAPKSEIMQAIRQAFVDFDVVRMYADPPGWQTELDQLRAEFGALLVVDWWTNRDLAMAAALERLHTDVTGRITGHVPDAAVLGEVVNARTLRRERSGRELILVRKPSPNSADKIDAVVTDALAYEARGDALAASATAAKPDRSKYLAVGFR